MPPKCTICIHWRLTSLQGNSVIMYKNSDLRRFQYYVNPDWVGGVYASPSIAGSRYAIPHLPRMTF